MKYAEVFSRLTYETAFLIFLKRDGTVRLMLGTRNLHTVELLYGFKGKELGGHDNRCSINNGNIAVFDLVVGEVRAFNIDRLVDITFNGIIKSKAELEDLMGKFMEFKSKYNNDNITSDIMSQI